MRCYSVEMQYCNKEWGYFTFKDYASAIHFFNECAKVVFPLIIYLYDNNERVIQCLVYDSKTYKMIKRGYN